MWRVFPGEEEQVEDDGSGVDKENQRGYQFVSGGSVRHLEQIEG
jgi:hypothetical protein